ncbi:MAG: hypothetical protein GY909_09450 [Oligoflexia bacterium]|nr:hypothetical protein [Oligoflexia bacterium]
MNKLFTLFFLFITSIVLMAKEVPALKAPVMDQPDIISWGVEKKLNYILKKFKKDTDIQLQVFIVSSLDGEPIENYSIKVTDEWKLGSETGDKGALLLIALNDRKMRIEVGHGLEGDITDADAGRIIQSMVPYFRGQQFESGIVVALKQIALLTGHDLSETAIVKTKKVKTKSNSVFLTIFIIMYILILIFGRGRRRGSYWYIGGASSRSSSSSGFSSGGGWSGGGGSFGGGGASGSW